LRGLRVPALVDLNRDTGWAVLEDFGLADAEVFLEGIAPSARLSQVQRCLSPVARLAQLRPHDLPRWNPPLDATRLRWELAGFELWFLRHRLEVTPSRTVGLWLDELADAIDRHPKRVCHRDYHLNNLFLLTDNAVGLIDYQDMLVGPDTYDAVSLLGERGLPRLLDPTARTQVQEAWAVETAALEGWQERWPLVRMQRALKVLGTFARLDAQGAQGYRPWMDDLACEIGPELSSLNAPSELVDLLLDLSRRRELGQDE
jgi:aminoglycoside/choline kinase family phosphotransferase